MNDPTTRIPPIMPTAAARFHGAGLTHVGMVRERNEDSILTDPTGTLWAVADGMGGHGHGDVASEIVIDTIASLSDEGLATASLRGAIARANDEILSRGDPGRMGSTVVAAIIRGGTASIVWAGDCRAYLFRSGILRLLTTDHTVVQEMIDQGVLAEKDRERHPERHVVTRAVGVDRNLQLDSLAIPLQSGDILILCSDGLTACVADTAIAEAARGASDPDSLCKALVTRALENGAPDNVSVVVVRGER